MTELSGNEVREVLWASGDEGKAQLRAAWAMALRLGLERRGVTQADVMALLWAVHEATAAEAAPEPVRQEPDAARREFRRMLFAHAKAGTTYTLRSLRYELAEAGFLRPPETVRRWLAEDRPELEALGIRLPPPGEDET